MGQQVGVYTSQEATTQVTDADGNPYTVPTWYEIQQSLAAVQAAVAAIGSGNSGGSGGGGGGYISWDGAATAQNVPFGIAITSATDLTEDYTGTAVATVDSTGTILTADGSVQANGAYVEPTCSYAHKGTFPSTSGKYWLILQVDNTVADPTQNYLEFNYVVDTNINFPDLSGYTQPVTQLLSVSYTMSSGGATTVNVNYPGAANPVSYTLPEGVTNLLLTFDTQDSILSVYADQLIVTYTGVGQDGYPYYWGGVHVTGDIDAYAQKTVVTFNVTDATQSPFPIPAGFAPMTTTSMAVPPSTPAPGEFIESVTSCVWEGNVLIGGQLYVYLGASGGLFTMPTLSSLPQLDQTNSWQLPQLIGNNVLYGTDHFQNNFIGVGQQNTGGQPGYAQGYVSGSTFLGGAFPDVIPQASSSLFWAPSGYASASNGGPFGYINSIMMGEYAGNAAGYVLNQSIAIGPYALQVSAPSTPPAAIGNCANLYSEVAIGYGAGSMSSVPINQNGANQYSSIFGDVFLGAAAGQGLNVIASTDSGTYGNQSSLVVIGNQAGFNGSTFTFGTIAMGYGALTDMIANTSGDGLIGIGVEVGNASTVNGQGVVLIGFGAGENSSFEAGDVFVGANAGIHVTSNGNNAGFGPSAMGGAGTSSLCTALGYQSMYTGPAANNSTAVGANAQVTGDNQVQLGDSNTSSYAFGAVQDRSDIRDKAEVRDTQLGLEFIKGLRPVDFKWDMREDYVDRASLPTKPKLRRAPAAPLLMAGDPGYHEAFQAHTQERTKWLQEKAVYDQAMIHYNQDMQEWRQRNSISRIEHNGLKKRNRFHHGVIAQEVKAQADKMGVDFGGYQDHSVNGGEDVKTVGYGEFIGPIIKAIQEVDAKFASKDHVSKIVDAVVIRLSTQPAVLDKIAEAVAAQIAAKMNNQPSK
jgi:hypothetical protein